MNHKELSPKYTFKIDPWKWMSIMAAIPREWKLKIKSDSNLQNKLSTLNDNETYIIINNKYKLCKLSTTKEIYQHLIKNKIQVPTAIEKWINIFPFMESVDWSKIYSLPFTIIKEPYFHSF